MTIQQAFILHLPHAENFIYIVVFMKYLQLGNSAGVAVLLQFLQPGLLLVGQHFSSQEEQVKPNCFLKAVKIKEYCFLPLSSSDDLSYHSAVLSTFHHILYSSEVMKCRNKGKQGRKAEIRF